MLKRISIIVRDTVGLVDGKEIIPEKLSFMCIAGSVEGGTTTFLAFEERQAAPLFIIKLFRETATALDRIQGEMSLLRHLHLDPSISSTVPTVLCSGRVENAFFLAQEVLAGAPMPVRLDKSCFLDIRVMRHHLDIAVEWLAGLHAIRTARPDRECNIWESDIHAFLLVDPARLSSDFFIKMLEAESNFLSSRCIQHTDFCRQNILCVGPVHNPLKINVIDWTDGRLDGLALHDLFYFLVTYVALARSRPGLSALLEAFEFFFFSKNKYSQMIQSACEAYCDRVNIDRQRIIQYFGLFLARHTAFEANKLRHALKFGYIPGFNLSLALENSTPWEKTCREQLWYHLFLLTSRMADRFLPN